MYLFPVGFIRFAYHQQVTTPTNTKELRLQLWDGDQLVTENRLIGIISYSYYLFIELIELIAIFEFIIFQPLELQAQSSGRDQLRLWPMTMTAGVCSAMGFLLQSTISALLVL